MDAPVHASAFFRCCACERVILKVENQHVACWQTVISIMARIGFTPQTLNAWGHVGRRSTAPDVLASRPRWPGRQGAGAPDSQTAPGVRDPRRGVSISCDGGVRPPVEMMGSFIDNHREEPGVDPDREHVLKADGRAPDRTTEAARSAAPPLPWPRSSSVGFNNR